MFSHAPLCSCTEDGAEQKGEEEGLGADSLREPVEMAEIQRKRRKGAGLRGRWRRLERGG